ncbi:MipA/OmpV family protein [Zooshikella marina]|uniref:MipA/OmpV family protein n=1 Tax=Zooshikella ganghwensis TaxID=202772 RepID=UPI001BB07A48|nr:MipA/OmpV family protein [Zooshikella ganghwensis]MBU2706900.1 MipA/OmpV family protein [Zooshikella ganghwensis]
MAQKYIYLTALLCLSNTYFVNADSATIGIGVASVPDYLGSEDYETIPLLQASYQWDNFSYIKFTGNSLKWNILQDSTLHFGPMIHMTAERSDVDDDRVDALKNVDSSKELGFFIQGNAAPWLYGFEFYQDITAGHHGYVASAFIGYKTSMGDGDFTLKGNVDYLSSDFMDSFFSIDSDDANRSGLSTFNADSGMNRMGLTLLYTFSLSRDWQLNAFLDYQRLLDDASDSPVTDDQGDDNQYHIGLNIIHQWSF